MEILHHIAEVIRRQSIAIDEISLQEAARTPRLRKHRSTILDGLDVLHDLMSLAGQEDELPADWYSHRLSDLTNRAIFGDSAAACALRLLHSGYEIKISPITE